jgi:hypothetical protein
LLRDAEFINIRIGNVNGAGDFGEYILKIVNDKATLAPANANATKPESTATNGAQNPVQNGEKMKTPPPHLQKQAKSVTETESNKNSSE